MNQKRSVVCRQWDSSPNSAAWTRALELRLHAPPPSRAPPPAGPRPARGERLSSKAEASSSPGWQPASFKRTCSLHPPLDGGQGTRGALPCPVPSRSWRWTLPGRANPVCLGGPAGGPGHAALPDAREAGKGCVGPRSQRARPARRGPCAAAGAAGLPGPLFAQVLA